MQTQNETLKPKVKICDSNKVVLLYSVDGQGFYLSERPVRSEVASKQLTFTSVILCTYRTSTEIIKQFGPNFHCFTCAAISLY